MFTQRLGSTAAINPRHPRKLVSRCPKVRVPLQLCHLKSAVPMAKPKTGSVTTSPFSAKTLNRQWDSVPSPATDTGSTGQGGHYPPGRERTAVPLPPFAQKAQPFPTHLKGGVRSTVDQHSRGGQSSSTARETEPSTLAVLCINP